MALTSIGNGESNRSGVHGRVLKRKDAGEDGDKRADKVAKVVKNPVRLPEVPKAPPGE
jgi:hypothetical protein